MWVIHRAVVLSVAAGLCAVATPAAAQIGVGVKGGIATSTIATEPDNAGALNSRIDWTAGVFVVPAPNSTVTAQIEGMFSRRGAELSGDVFGFGLGEIRLTYLDLSGLVRLRGGGPGFSVYGLAGPTVGIALDAEFVVAGFSPSIDAAFKDTEVGLTFGAGVEVNRVLVEGRYMVGLTNIVEAIDVVGLSAKNRSFSVLVGVRF